MKLRIEGNSIRLRLGKSEVNGLAEAGKVCGSTQFPQGVFRYALELSDMAKNLEAAVSSAGITLQLPRAWGLEWPDIPRVGFENRIELEDKAQLHLLVEKDFVCLDRDPAMQLDQYPNPKSGTL